MTADDILPDIILDIRYLRLLQLILWLIILVFNVLKWTLLMFLGFFVSFLLII